MSYNSKFPARRIDELLEKIEKDNVGVVDSAITAESENPVTSKAIYEEFSKVNELDKQLVKSVETLTENAEKANVNIAELQENKANTKGYYPNLAVGLSDNLPDRGDVSEGVIGFRESAGAGNSIEDGTADVQSLEGNSVVWNQLFKELYTSGTATISKDNGLYICTPIGESVEPGSALWSSGQVRVYSSFANFDCKCLISFNYKRVSKKDGIGEFEPGRLKVTIGSSAEYGKDIVFGEKTFFSCISQVSTDDKYITISLNDCVCHIENISICNLTKMFGTGNEPATVEEFYSRCPAGVDLSAYNEGEVINVNPSGIKSVNDNAYNGKYAKVLGGREYCIDGTITALAFSDTLDGTTEAITLTDNKYIPPRNGYIYATGTDICIHLVHSGYKDHIYTPYEEYTMPVNISEYFPNGMCGINNTRDVVTKDKAIRRFASVDLGSLNWSYRTSDEGNKFFVTNSIQDKKLGMNLLCPKYTTTSNTPAIILDKTIYGEKNYAGLYNIVIQDSSYTDADSFKAAMQGVMLYYELAEPVVTNLAPQLNLSYKVWDFGTEELIPDGVSAPIITKTIYGFNATDTIRGNKFKNDEQDERLAKMEMGKVDREDYAPKLSVGFADNLVSKDITVDSDFSIRQSGGGAISDGMARIDEVRGNSVVINNIVRNGNFENASWWDAYNSILTISNGIATVEKREIGASGGIASQRLSLNTSHQYLISAKIASMAGDSLSVHFGNGSALIGNNFVSTTSSTPVYQSIIVTPAANSTHIMFRIGSASTDAGASGTVSELKVIDLTQMFGGGNEPATVEEFYQRIPQNINLNAYNEGQLINMNVDAVKSTGRNIWDEEWENGYFNENTGEVSNTGNLNYLRSKNYIPVAPNTEYYIRRDNNKLSGGRMFFYDVNRKYISNSDITMGSNSVIILSPSNAQYARFWLWDGTVGYPNYDNNICINISDTDFNGQYEPYKVAEKSLPPQIKEIFTDGMKSAGTAYDVAYNKDGKGYIVKRFGAVDMGTLSWSREVQSDGVTARFVSYGIKATAKNVDTDNSVANLKCAKYITTKYNDVYNNVVNDSIGLSVNQALAICDSSYTNKNDFIAAMSGIMLYYELAEPIITEYDEPFNLDYLVTNGGQEEAVATLPSSNLKANIEYGFNASGKIKENSNRIAALEAMITQLSAQLASMASIHSTDVE